MQNGYGADVTRQTIPLKNRKKGKRVLYANHALGCNVAIGQNQANKTKPTKPKESKQRVNMLEGAISHAFDRDRKSQLFLR